MKLPSRLLAATAVVIVAIVMSSPKLDIDDIVYDLIPLIPAEYVQFLGDTYAYYVTCVLYSVALTILPFNYFHQCESLPNGKLGIDHDTLNVIVATNKGGSVLGAFSTFAIASTCGYCMSIAERVDGAWPPKEQLNPKTGAKAYVAISHVPNWPEYAKQQNIKNIRCVVLTRDPFKRFQSLFTYARDGAEYTLHDAKKKIRAMDDMSKAVLYMWETIGKDTMIVTHDTLMKSLDPKLGCTRVRFEDIMTDFDGSMKKWLEAWNIHDAKAQEALLTKLAKYDIKRKKSEELAKDHHVSGKDLTSEQRKVITSTIMNTPGIRDVLESQAKDLGYPIPA